MIKQTLKWNQNGSKKEKLNKSNWIHHPDALKNGHVAYVVKFLGSTEVDQPKGIDVVKEGIRKMKFNQHLKRAEGNKIPKVELTISVDGVAVQDPKTKRIMYQYPLHRISYCADDKSDKKFFSFIAKETDSETHCCFVFVSDKLSEEITLTIGQAFDLAYKRFLESSGRDLEMRKQFMLLQKRYQELEKENSELKAKLSEYENKNSRLKGYSNNSNGNNNSKLITTTSSSSPVTNGTNGTNGTIAVQLPPPTQQNTRNKNTMNLLDFDSLETQDISNGFDKRFDKLYLNDSSNLNNNCDNDDNFDPRGFELLNNKNNSNNNDIISPNGHLNGNNKTDIFGCEPFNPSKLERNDDVDPFGMKKFQTKDLDQAIGYIDKKLSEMRDGFSRGLSFGNDDFSIEALDPLNQK